MLNMPFANCFDLTKLSMMQRSRLLLVAAVLLWLPGVGGLLKQTMLGHMLVQVSLLVLVGYALGATLLHGNTSIRILAHTYRWACLLTTVSTLAVWMIPRLLDLAVEIPWIDAAKVLSLVFAAGVPLAWSWHSLPVVVRCVLHVEALATVWRLGWLYLDSPVRLCSRYGLDDQQRLGYVLMVLGAAYALWLANVALFGVALPVAQERLQVEK